jgi:hypothetical protein
VRRDKDNWAPRFGFAWSPDAHGRLFEKTVFRGGYGITYEQMYNHLLPFTAQNFPQGVTTLIGPVNGRNFFDLTARPASVTVADFVAAGGNSSLLPATIVGSDADRRFETPYYQHWSFGLEREVLRDLVFKAYYVGSKGTHLLRAVDRNPGVTTAAFAANPAFFTAQQLQPVFSSTGSILNYRLDPTRGPMTSIDSIGNSMYHSGQFSLVKRYSIGMQWDASYTYSSYISDSDDFRTLSGNPFDLRADRARSTFDQPHRLVASYLFMIPSFQTRPFLTRIVSGWEITGTTLAATGMRYSVLDANNALGLLPAASPFFVSGLRPSSLLFPDAPFSGTLGTLGRNTQRLPWVHDTDLGFVKRFRTFSENQALQLRAEVFNVFNHRNYTTAPFNLLGTGLDSFRLFNVGQTSAPGRQFVFTARYFF